MAKDRSEYFKEYRKAHPEKARAWSRKWKKNNKEYIELNRKYWPSETPEKRRERSRIYKKKNPDKIIAYRIKNGKINSLRRKEKGVTDPDIKRRDLFHKKKSRLKINLSYEEYKKMFILQKNTCAICGQKEMVLKSLSLDHCHKTGKVRELLCQKCNTGLGMFRETPDLLKKAIKYLRKHS